LSPIETFDRFPEALAHILAALTRTLEHLAPGDPTLAEGFDAWRELSPWATLPAARGFADVLGPDSGGEISIDARATRG
jgi:hypothetical protein